MFLIFKQLNVDLIETRGKYEASKARIKTLTREVLQLKEKAVASEDKDREQTGLIMDLKQQVIHMVRGNPGNPISGPPHRSHQPGSLRTDSRMSTQPEVGALLHGTMTPFLGPEAAKRVERAHSGGLLASSRVGSSDSLHRRRPLHSTGGGLPALGVLGTNKLGGEGNSRGGDELEEDRGRPRTRITGKTVADIETETMLRVGETERKRLEELVGVLKEELGRQGLKVYKYAMSGLYTKKWCYTRERCLKTEIIFATQFCIIDTHYIHIYMCVYVCVCVCVLLLYILRLQRRTHVCAVNVHCVGVWNGSWRLRRQDDLQAFLQPDKFMYVYIYTCECVIFHIYYITHACTHARTHTRIYILYIYYIYIYYIYVCVCVYRKLRNKRNVIII